jgi:hypothetical protein
MPEYAVRWEIDVIANSPREAAEIAEGSYMRTEGARVYEVQEHPPVGLASPWDMGRLLAVDVVDLDLPEGEGGDR